MSDDLALAGTRFLLPELFGRATHKQQQQIDTDNQTDTVDVPLLTPEQLQSYEKDGFVAGIPCLSPEQVSHLRDVELPLLMRGGNTNTNTNSNTDSDAVDTAKADNVDPRWYEFNANESDNAEHVLFHSLGAWRIMPGFHDLVMMREITARVQQLLTLEHNKQLSSESSASSVGVRFWHDQLFCKPPFNGSCVAWHQDYSYWTRTTPMNHITVHIALDDQTLENGALHYIPGSHKWPLLPITSRHFGDMESVLQVLDAEQKEQFKPVPVLLKAGELSFHHALTMHGSFGNQSSVPRRAAVANYFADGTVAANDHDELLKGVPTVSKGTKLEGVFFPLVIEGAAGTSV